MRSKKPFSAGRSTFAIFIALLLASAIIPTPAHARKFKVLHTFHGAPADGALPWTQLSRDAAGNLYGTTESGGGGNCQAGCGTAFKLNNDGKQVWLHSFNGKNGRTPAAGLLRTGENLYGTTVEGGYTTCFSLGCGTVFKLNKTGAETVLHKFTGTPDGFFPESLLVEDGLGNLYGTAAVGGTSSNGAVFKIDTAGKETVLYSFTGGSDGCFPYPGVIRDRAGNLYGVTSDGGAGFCNSGYGVVFKLDTSLNETVLYSFGGSDGANPSSVLLFDSHGNLYGTTQNGGNSECGGTGCGVVFELSPEQNGGWTEKVRYDFCSLSGCTDGERPMAGPLRMDAAGNLYGTTYFGGTYGDGVIFELDTMDKETVLHSFTGGPDGAVPPAGLVLDKAGNLYGTAELGGDTKCAAQGCGVVFELTP